MGTFLRHNATIHFTAMGHGRALVLIHGLGASQGFWGPRLLLPLARRFRVVLPDLRGHGRSSAPATGYAPKDFAEDILALLDRLHIPQADLVGHSFGGVVALQCAVMARDRVRSIFLADTRVRSLEDSHAGGALAESVLIRRRLEAVGLPIPTNEKEAGLWLLEQFASPRQEKTREELCRTEPFIPFTAAGGGGGRSARRWLDLLERTSFREEFGCHWTPSRQQLAAIGQPVMAMCGESAFTRHSLSALAGLIPRLRTSVVPGAGHFFPLTHTGRFLEELTGFLAGVQEFRREERLPTDLDVQVVPAGAARFAGRILNISRHGLLVEGGEMLAVGTEVEILLPPFPDGDACLYRGTVVRHEVLGGDRSPRLGVVRTQPDGVDRDWSWGAELPA